MNLTEVSLKDVSSLQHRVYLPPSRKFEVPAFKVISYVGAYRSGGAGKGDALYIKATATAAHEAWYTRGTIIDFTELAYDWGDEMLWVQSLIDPLPVSCAYPLLVVVGPKCEPALRSLLKEDYEGLCLGSLDLAVQELSVKIAGYEQCLREWRAPKNVEGHEHRAR